VQPLLLVFVAGLLGGAMNALVGGGSFVTLPVLIAVGVPSVNANTSSTVALFPGGIASAWSYRAGLGPVGSATLRSLFIVTTVGGALGACLLLWTSSSAFDKVLPWLLLVATTSLIFGRRLSEWMRARFRMSAPVVLGIQFCLGIYGGYFGGGVGIMMLAIWSLLDSRDLKSLQAPRTLLVTSANAIAVIIFAAARAVYWYYTAAMLVGATLGGLLGAEIGKRAPATVVRVVVLTLTTAITAVFFWRAYASQCSH
jgi:uncharacterized membrane protein YfcA